jgi:hypothetical protein
MRYQHSNLRVDPNPMRTGIYDVFLLSENESRNSPGTDELKPLAERVLNLARLSAE